LIVELDRVKSVPGVWAVLESNLAGTEVVLAARTTPQGESRPLWQWEADQQGRREGRITEVSFAVSVFPGGSKANLTFCCLTDEAALPPQSEIQLQLIADATQAALMRLNVESPRGMIHEVSPGVAGQAQ
jgi:hypothetical protein